MYSNQIAHHAIVFLQDQYLGETVMQHAPIAKYGGPEKSVGRCTLRTLAERIATFSEWPKQLTPSGKDLALAGFYYTGTGDKVICETCGVGLNEWESGDDPWIEHNRYSPNCLFLKSGPSLRILTMRIEKTEKTEKPVPTQEAPTEVSESLTCVVCQDRKRNIVSLPCRHLVTCKECNDRLSRCPICQQEEHDRLQVNIS